MSRALIAPTAAWATITDVVGPGSRDRSAIEEVRIAVRASEAALSAEVTALPSKSSNVLAGATHAAAMASAATVSTSRPGLDRGPLRVSSPRGRCARSGCADTRRCPDLCAFLGCGPEPWRGSHNTCITSPRHSKVLSGTREHSVSAGQRPDLRHPSRPYKAKVGGSRPSAPTEKAECSSAVGAGSERRGALPWALSARRRQRPRMARRCPSGSRFEDPRPRLNPRRPGRSPS